MNLDEIYRQYFRAVYRYVLSLSRDPDVAEEITQETFFTAIKKINDFKGECSVQTWLCEIAKNTYFKQAARQKSKDRYLEQQEVLSDSSGESSEDRIIRREEEMQAHRILHRLDEPYKEVAMLRIFSELSFREIAELFGRSESWARVTYMRARRKIQEEWKNEDSM